MPRPGMHMLGRIALGVALAAPGLWQLGLLLYAVLARVSYPYDLEWMEGGMLVHADRLAAGKDIYVAPSVEFIPYLYTPLYPALLGGMGQIVGLTYGLGRAVSVLALAAVLGLMAWAIRSGADTCADGKADETANSQYRLLAWLGAAGAAGFVAATYPWVEGWYDLVRGDTLFLAMVLGGLMAVRGAARSPATGWRAHARAAGAAALLALSFFCKQTGVLYVATGGALLLVWRWRLVPVYVAISGLIGLGGTWLLNRRSDGWFWTYAYEVHQAHDFSMDRFYKSFGNILLKFPVMTAVIALALIAVAAAAMRTRTLPRSAGGLLTWSFVFAVSCLVGALGWGTQWAHFNAYIPAMTTGALACGMALPALWGALAELTRYGNGTHEPSRWALAGRTAVIVAALAVAGQLVAERWNPRRFIPTDRDRAAGDALIARLRELRAGGDIYIPYHPWYARLAGQQETYVHRMGIMDVTYGNKWRVAGLAEALRQARFAAVVLDNRPPGAEFPGLRQGYRLDQRLPASVAPRVYTGAKVVPATVWLPIKSPVPAGAEVLFDFEQGKPFAGSGWQVEGTAWGRAPISRPAAGQGEISGYRGRYFSSSRHGGDSATGMLTSPTFMITGPRMSLRMSGGHHAGTLRAELRVDGQAVRTAANTAPGEHMTEHTWDVAELVGREARLVLVDQATGSWGHLSVDDVLIWRE